MECERPDAILPFATYDGHDEGPPGAFHSKGRIPLPNRQKSAEEQGNTETLVLQLKDAEYRALVVRAAEEGCSIEELITECVHGLLDA